MGAIFNQSSFIGGLDTTLDATKTPQNAYPLLINGRTRQDIIEPTAKHLLLKDYEDSEVQAIFAAGGLVVIFVAGVAYYADITQPSIVFLPVVGWTTMATTGRIYAELVTSTTNFFNRTGLAAAADIGLTPGDLTSRVFNASIQGIPQALFCFDGVNQPQAIFVSGNPLVLGTYASWTKDKPEYVPVGVLPAVQNNKLFLVLPDRRTIVSSVSGRMSDFVIVIDANGEKAGSAEALGVSASYHEITNMRPLSSGQVLIQTLYASYVLNLDYGDPIFAEPNLIPTFAFPIGTINDLSSVDMLGDTAFITQSGIHSFNAVSQLKKESNNFALGVKIKGLLLNPQSLTCAGQHNDYAYFAVNTIFGRGVLVCDISRSVAASANAPAFYNFQSLDLSFGNVKQFASTKISGAERMFFITQDNKVFEAFAGEGTNPVRTYLGEWSATDANQDLLVDMVDAIFTNVATAGYCKITLFSDRKKHEEAVIEVPATGYINNYPIQIPFTSAKQIATASLQLETSARAWKVGVMLEWNFNGALSNVSLDGAERTADNTDMVVQAFAEPESFAFVADTGFGPELNNGAVFNAGGVKAIGVHQGARYIYYANGDGDLVNGKQVVTDGVFTAAGPQVAVSGTAGAAPTFSLKHAEDLMSVLSAIYEDGNITTILGGGDHSYDSGTQAQVYMGLLPLRARLPFYAVAGNHDIDTSLGLYFYNSLGIPRYYSKAFNFVEFFFYNGGWTTPNVAVDINGNTAGPTSEPSGNDVDSLQAQWLRNALAASVKPFKIIIVHEPPRTTSTNYYPGYAALRFLETLGASAIISGHGHVMERFVTADFPSFVCGTGGKSLSIFRAGTDGIAAFRDNLHFGYLFIKPDPLTCEVQFRDTDNNVLDAFSLYVR